MDIEKKLLQGALASRQLQGIALNPQQGGLSRLVATFRARRQANKNADLIEALKQKEEQTRSRIIGQLSPEQRPLAEEVDTDTLKKMMAKRLEASFGTPTPLSAEGKREADVRSGLLSRDQARANQFNITPEVQEIPDLGERAKTIEQISNQNAQAGNFKLAREQRQQATILRREKGLIDKDVKSLAKGLDDTGFTGLIDALEKSSSIINEAEDIPGAGKTGALPELLLSSKGKKLRQSVATVRNAILKARSGGAVTPSEASRLLEEIGTGKTKTDEQLRTGLQNAIDILKTKVETIQASVRPEAVNIFRQRGKDPFARLENLNIATFGAEQPTEQNLKDVSDEELLEGF
jgi:hypothetical protein